MKAKNIFLVAASIHRKQDGSSSSNPQAQKSEAYAEFSQGRPEEGSAFTNQ
jgi:hypothetical protein